MQVNEAIGEAINEVARGEWEREEDDGDSARTQSSSSLTLIDD